MSGELSGLANASLWPGVSEIEGIVKGLIDRMKVRAEQPEMILSTG